VVLVHGCRFGGLLKDYPHPEVDFEGFVRFIEKKCAAVRPTWDPVSKEHKPWIDTRKLVQVYGPQPACSPCTIA
jgi:hypothetical protein